LKVILFNISSRDAIDHFRKTAIQGISRHQVASLLSFAPTMIPSNQDRIRLWGTKPSPRNISAWRQVSSGDLALYCRKRKIVALAVIAGIERNHKVARHVWGEQPDGSTWELLYFLSEVIETEIVLSTFNQAIGYARFYYPRGLLVVNQARLLALSQETGDLKSSLLRLGKRKLVQGPDQEREPSPDG